MQQNMQGQGLLLGNMQLGSQSLQWQQNPVQQAPTSQPSGFQGVVQAGPCPQTILAPVQQVQGVQLIGMPTPMQAMPAGMQFVPMNCQNVQTMPNVMVGNQEWKQWQQPEQPAAGGCVVKNTFVHMTEELTGAANGRRRESSEPPRMRSSEGFEDSDDEIANYNTSGHDGRQFSEPPQANGQYLVIPSQNSLKSAERTQMSSVTMSVEEQLLQMNGKHQAEQQQLLAHQQMEQQKLIEQYQQRQSIETMHEELQGDNTDDEDCIGQYQPPQALSRPMAPTDGAMQWMTATLEGMCMRPAQGQVPQPSPNMGGLPLPAAMADTGSTPEPMAPGKKFNNKKMPKNDEDGGSGASIADQLANGDARKTAKRATDPYNWEDGVVTVMVRQLPRQYTQRMLLQEVVRRGFEGLFDFLYLPYDFKKGINVGYGFINFTEPEYAMQFRDSLDGQYLDKYMRLKGKAVRVHPAQVQGYEANYRHFAHTKTGQKQDPAFSPLFFPVLQQGAMRAIMKSLKEGRSKPDVGSAEMPSLKPMQDEAAVQQANATGSRPLDQNLLQCQQMTQQALNSRVVTQGMGSNLAQPQPQQMLQVGLQGLPGSPDDRQMPKPKGKAKKQNPQNKLSPPAMPLTFSSGGVTWVGIPFGASGSQSWGLERPDGHAQAQESPQQGVTYGWMNAADMDLNC